jgi:hypothetical protein
MRGEIRWDTSLSASDRRHRSERTPVKSFRQALWGGWIHAKCRCEVDQWGRLTTRHVSLMEGVDRARPHKRCPIGR